MDDEELLTCLRKAGLIESGTVDVTPLTGGVSSDIRLVSTPERRFVVKRALDKLRVADDWYADRSRNDYEQAYMRYVGQIVPEAVPSILYSDPAEGFFVMEYLGDDFRNWKALLLAGRVDGAYAEEAGRILGRIHGESWQDERAAASFDSTRNFYELRLEPYLLTTAMRHPDLADFFEAESARIEKTRLALVHGDYSPKNMLVCPDRFVLLDCEVAWYGEPAFDAAFLLNHFLLKSLYMKPSAERYLSLAERFWGRYLRELGQNRAAGLEVRVARLLPMLLLARVDGKSPAEYLTDRTSQDLVRRFAADTVPAPPSDLSTLLALWRERLG